MGVQLNKWVIWWSLLFNPVAFWLHFCAGFVSHSGSTRVGGELWQWYSSVDDEKKKSTFEYLSNFWPRGSVLWLNNRVVYCTFPTTGLLKIIIFILHVYNTFVNLRFLAFCEHMFYLCTEKLQTAPLYLQQMTKWSSPLFKELCADLDSMISNQQIHKQIFLSPPGTTLWFSIFF